MTIKEIVDTNDKELLRNECINSQYKLQKIGQILDSELPRDAMILKIRDIMIQKF